MNRETNPELVRKISRLQFEVCSLKGQLKAVMADRDQAYQALNIERTASDTTGWLAWIRDACCIRGNRKELPCKTG